MGGKEMGSNYPEGWNEKRVISVLKHYEKQNEFEAVSEDEASFELNDKTYIEIPKKLVTDVRKLLVHA
ncbi:MAG: hypothetical protein V1833_06525 [Elusimicrobiota bacterium]